MNVIACLKKIINFKKNLNKNYLLQFVSRGLNVENEQMY